MFNYLKEKLKKAVGSFQEKIEEEVPEQESQEAIALEETKEPLATPEDVKETIEEELAPEDTLKKEESVGSVKEETSKFKEPTQKPKEEVREKPEEEQPQKRTFLQYVKEKVTTKTISEEKFEELFWDIELTLLENNVAVEVIEKLKTDLKETLVNKPIKKTDYDTIILTTLTDSISEVLTIPTINLLERIKHKKERPYTIAFIGVNGVGKTTTIAKIAHYLKQHNLTSILAAGDTWRAGSVEQLNTWAEQLTIPIVKAQYGADPASIAYDAIAMAKAKHLDVVLIDTAGRQHKNTNLMRELNKILSVNKPDLTLLVVESIVGNDAVEQATQFSTSINIDGSILTKADIDEKGGAILSIAYVTKKPILFLGVGQEPENLEEFTSEKILERIGLT